MKINNFIRKYYIDIFFFIILLIIFMGGIMAPGITSADETSAGKTIPVLMESMNISPLPELNASPDFNLMSIAEEQINLKQQRGKVVLLSFWATW
jgi:hypothetical protein